MILISISGSYGVTESVDCIISLCNIKDALEYNLNIWRISYACLKRMYTSHFWRIKLDMGRWKGRRKTLHTPKICPTSYKDCLSSALCVICWLYLSLTERKQLLIGVFLITPWQILLHEVPCWVLSAQIERTRFDMKGDPFVRRQWSCMSSI